MTVDNSTPQELAQPEVVEEALTGQLAFRSTDSDKNHLRVIAFWNDETESEVLRRYFDFEAFRAEGDRIRALKATKETAAA